MLDALRTAAGTWVAKLLLLILVGSFAVWGISGNLVRGVGNAVLAAGDSIVTPNEFRLAYERQLNIFAQQSGTRLTREQAQSLGVDQRVLSQLMAGVVLDEHARNLNLGLSKDRIARLTAEDEAFQDSTGKFNREQFDRVLANAGMRPEDYLRNREQVAVRQQIVEAIGDGIAAPDTLLKAIALHRDETRTVSYVVIPEGTAAGVAPPSETDLRAHFDANKNDYRAPEYRKISYMKLEPADIAKADSISSADAKADYDKRIARYTTPEKRTIEQLVLPNDKTAQDAKAKLDSGTPFEEVVKAAGKTMADVQLGEVMRDGIPDKAIADAAFSLAANQVSPLINGSFGKVLIRVTAVTPQVVRGFAEVEAEIKQELALNAAKQQLFDVHDGVEDALGGGATLAEAARKFALKIVTVDAADQTGQRPDGSVIKDIPESDALLRAAFDAEPNTENLPLNTAGGGFVWYMVDAVTQARDRTFEEVKQKVTRDWMDDKSANLLSAKAEELRKKAVSGTPLETIATEIGQQVAVKRGVRRDANDAELGEQVVEAAFSGAQGLIGVGPGPDGKAQILFKVDEVAEPAGASAQSLPENARDAAGDALSNDLLDQFVGRLQGTYPVTVNEAAVNAALRY